MTKDKVDLLRHMARLAYASALSHARRNKSDEAAARAIADANKLFSFMSSYVDVTQQPLSLTLTDIALFDLQDWFSNSADRLVSVTVNDQHYVADYIIRDIDGFNVVEVGTIYETVEFCDTPEKQNKVNLSITDVSDTLLRHFLIQELTRIFADEQPAQLEMEFEHE